MCEERERETTAGVSQMEWNGFKMVRKSLPPYSTIHCSPLFHLGTLQWLVEVVVVDVLSLRLCSILLKHRRCTDTIELFVVQNVKFPHAGERIQQGGRPVRLVGRIEAEGDSWGDGARYHAISEKVGWGEQWRKGGREGLNQGNSTHFMLKPGL